MSIKLSTIEEEVTRILEKYPQTRASDEKLYGVYLASRIGLVSAIEFFNNFPHYGVAQFESVARCRRKVQETREDLRPSDEVQQARGEVQETFIKWALGTEEQ